MSLPQKVQNNPNLDSFGDFFVPSCGGFLHDLGVMHFSVGFVEIITYSLPPITPTIPQKSSPPSLELLSEPSVEHQLIKLTVDRPKRWKGAATSLGGNVFAPTSQASKIKSTICIERGFLNPMVFCLVCWEKNLHVSPFHPRMGAFAKGKSWPFSLHYLSGAFCLC